MPVSFLEVEGCCEVAVLQELLEVGNSFLLEAPADFELLRDGRRVYHTRFPLLVYSKDWLDD